MYVQRLNGHLLCAQLDQKPKKKEYIYIREREKEKRQRKIVFSNGIDDDCKTYRLLSLALSENSSFRHCAQQQYNLSISLFDQVLFAQNYYIVRFSHFVFIPSWWDHSVVYFTLSLPINLSLTLSLLLSGSYFDKSIHIRYTPLKYFHTLS